MLHADLAQMAALRRALHQIPEQGNEEFKTHDFLVDYLSRLPGFEVKTLITTGVKATLRVPGAQRTIAFRSDIDALAISERTGLPFASKHPGCMHACGHDGHMTCLLTFASLLSAQRDLLEVNVVLIFQPAEESIGGARRMIEAGAFADPKVDEVYGLHLMPDIPQGKIGLSEGPVMAGTTEFDLVIRGRSAHGAMPYLGVDAINAAGMIVGQIQQVITRTLPAKDMALVTFGRIEGGTRRNILADEVRLEGIFRTFTDEIYQRTRQGIEAVLRGAEAAWGVSCALHDVAVYPPVVNHPMTTRRVRELVDPALLTPVEPYMISEDFSEYQRQVPGTFLFLGVRNEQLGMTSPLHADSFNFDESALALAVALYQRLVGLN